MKIPSPTECGLPEKFTAWRSNQEQSIDVMITSGKRAIGLSAPTGFGKSPAYVAAALLSKKPTCIVTNSKGLQDQLMRDYESIGMVDLKGKSNYPCSYNDDYSCEEGYSASCPFKGTVQCAYSRQEMKATVSNLVVTNYSKWINSRLTMAEGNWMSRFQQIVFDEGHDAPDAVSNAMQITLTEYDIETMLQLHYPQHVDSMACWSIWARSAKTRAREMVTDWEKKVAQMARVTWVKQLVRAKNLLRKLAVLSVAQPNNWVVDEVENGYQFDPIRPAMYAEGVLLLRVPRIVIVSATLRPKTMWMLGLRNTDFEFHEFDSDFPRSRCPIYWVPTMRVDIRAKDLSPLWIKLDQIMSRRTDRSGIIHTVSYERQRLFLEHSRYASKMLANVRGEPITDTIEKFKASPRGTVLISPAVSTGYDFPGTECEYQFMAKIPFPDGRAKIHQARQADDSEYGAYRAMQSMVQAFGRGMRSREDQCEGVIVDDHVAWFIPKFAHLAPKSFHTHFRKSDVVPAPPDRL